MKFNKAYQTALLFTGLSLSFAAAAMPEDCIITAAQCFKVNPLIIKAIIWQESKNKQAAVNTNKNNTVDVGLMQINSIHFRKLNSLGISESNLRKNSCANVFAGTWILHKAIQRNGYTWDGVGSYHSSTPEHRDPYVKKIINTIAYKHSLIRDLRVMGQGKFEDKFNCPN